MACCLNLCCSILSSSHNAENWGFYTNCCAIAILGLGFQGDEDEITRETREEEDEKKYEKWKTEKKGEKKKKGKNPSKKMRIGRASHCFYICWFFYWNFFNFDCKKILNKINILCGNILYLYFCVIVFSLKYLFYFLILTVRKY